MRRSILILAMAIFSICYASAQDNRKLEVTENGHFLQYDDGSPFFYLGDTAWELFHRLDREQADIYLQDRAQKGYNVIQAVALAELDGVDVDNAYGHKPLVNRNPAQPATAEGEQNDYWDHVDYIVSKANSLGMYIGLLPTWGRYWNDGNPIFNPQNAEAYGRWIAERYRTKKVIWILGGDRNPDNGHKQAIIRAMARGIRSVDKQNLITFHPTGWQTSSKWFHNDKWLAFNGRQSGHHQRYDSNSRILEDFNRKPTKPILELEPLYEDHPLEFQPDNEGHSTAWDVRRALYWSVFYGSAGVTYGHHSVWQMYDKGRGPINRPLMPWHEAIEQPAAAQAQYLKNLMLSRPYFTRRPAPDFIVQKENYSEMPGKGRYHFAATIDTEGNYAMVYAPIGREFQVKGEMLHKGELIAWWYNPRTGKASKIGKVTNDGSPISFTPPMLNEAIDWVLVLDNAKKHYPTPGKIKK